MEAEENTYFEQFGYQAEESCIEMKLDLGEFQFETFQHKLHPETLSFCYYEGDKTDLLEAVRIVEEDWVQYFLPELPIYVAKKQEKVVGFTILGFDEDTLLSDESKKVGSVGCVGVIPEERNQGIGLALVAYATNELKQKKCDIAWIHYTYLESWYSTLGYNSYLRYWFGKKELNLQTD